MIDNSDRYQRHNGSEMRSFTVFVSVVIIHRHRLLPAHAHKYGAYRIISLFLDEGSKPGYPL